MPEMSTTQPSTGWLCPVCGAVYAPWVASCLRCPVASASYSMGITTGSICPVCLGSTVQPPAQGCRCDEYHTASHA